MDPIFTFAEHGWIYLVFILIILSLLVLDLGVFHRKSHEVTFKEAASWSVVWILLSIAFGWGLSQLAPPEHSSRVFLEYITGFVVEKTLAVDNIFVFVLVFSFFRIPKEYQHRVLFFGILGALFFRALFIGISSYLMQFHWVHLVFGVFLIGTGLKMAIKSGEDENLEDNKLVQWLCRTIPLTSKLHGQKFWIRENGKWIATPLFLALVVLEFTDIIFAVDSVPAIFAITKDPLIVLTSNIFAILGLRSLYFMLASVIDKFHLLKYGLAAVLVFVGFKMTYMAGFGGHIPISWSLAIIGTLLGSSIIASIFFPKKETPV